MKQDITKISSLLIICALCGWAVGYPLQLTLLASLTVIVWLLYRFRSLHQWLNHRQAKPPESDGLLYLLHRDIQAMRKRNKQQKRLLSATLKQFRQAAAILPDAVVILNIYGEIQWANKLARELLGITWPADNNLRITNLLRNPVFTDAMAEVQTTPLNLDIDSPLDNNRKINVKVIDFEADSQMLVARDITRLTAINQTQKDFVGNVSHELKTPLTVLRGYIEMIQDHKKLDASLKKPADDMAIQVKRMQSMIEDLLYLSKLEQDTKPKFDKPVIVNELIHDSHKALSSFIEQKQHRIEFDIDTKLHIIGSDRELFSVFNNLMLNAINYTQEQGIIRVKWLQRDNTAVLSVADNGQGIAPKHIGRLTERFYRADSDRARHKGGTGLGLAIVQNILQRHGAQLNIISHLGSGSCFECIFPEEMIVSHIKDISKIV